MGRLVYLDNLRSFALLLGIVFHAAIVYASDIKYAIQDEKRSEILSYFCYWIHCYRMPMFYMISGFFSAMVWTKKGRAFYLEARFKRVLIPTMFGLIFLAPIQYYLTERINNPGLDFLPFLEFFFTKDHFQHSHIWFLVDLFFFSILYSLIPKAIFTAKIWNHIPKGIFRYITLVIFCFLFVYLFHTQIPKGESYYGVFKLTFVFQFSFFLAGVFCFHWQNILFPKNNSTVKIIAILVWAILVFLIFKELEIDDPLWINFQYANLWNRTLHIFLWVIAPFLWTSFLVYIFQTFGNKDGRLGFYLIEASLPIYLLHHPMSLVYAYWVREMPWGIWVKFISHILVVLGVSFFFYEFLIRKMKPLRFLFGLKSK
ncbi:acyltransferase family protein [Leptospira sp. 2 VSF19]|uniref:Acyltransferase family protein n=1 Tax=Leptospira soteropolitanensis TaxID=2950025 RepID=A0AAW5VPQ7_9LEPT|nr:acyltransferase family protein [Leptospira soteropolitanensis]MCW7494448.1 acyltransferase family protein [Leptospira soteropolitanensis]MCW7502042.1 acyltransferase family protein [Leptospira soteropolitanensis]MCW7524294.1 acyltransferase family protein [Leptospira soteropolitanensis]MCW7528159.1 acyltransferase family protein [Leptospira soteropolitanensis]MCW7532012.1 acyltransferase family protein [Leptospira soteropolitanensis]